MPIHDNRGRKEFRPVDWLEEPALESGVSPGKVTLTSRVVPSNAIADRATVQRKTAAGAAPGATRPQPGAAFDSRAWDAAFRPDLADPSELEAASQAPAARDAPEPGSPAAIVGQLSGGQSLDSRVSSRVGELYGDSFSDVRVHTDAKAAQLARNEDALAFTVGREIVFSSGKYQPNTPEGDALLAHELAHVVQQRGAGEPSAVQSKAASSATTGVLESDADQAAIGVIARLYGGAVGAVRSLGARVRPALDADVSLQRCPSGSDGGRMPEGSITPSGSVAHTTGEQLDTFLGSSAALADYVKDRIDAGNGAAGNVRFHGPDEFTEAWVIYSMRRINPDTGANFTRAEAEAWEPTVNAFRDGSIIHIHRDRGEPGTAIHEGIHLFSSDTYKSELGFNANEGTTEYFARVVCAEQGIARGSFYPDQRRSIDKLVATTSQEVVAGAYFNGNVSGLESAVDGAQGAGTFAQWKTHMRAGDYAAADALL